METPLGVVQKHWQKDAGHLPGSLPSTPPPGGPAPLPSTTSRGPSSPSPPPRPRGARPPAVRKARPHWAPSPAAGAPPALFRRAWGDPPWALPFILPLPRLVPETPAPPHACFPSPDGATAREPPRHIHSWGATAGLPAGEASRSIFPQKAVSRCYSALAMSNQDNEPGRKNQTAVGAAGDGRSIDIHVSFHHALLRHEERRASTHTLTAHLLGS